MKSFAISLFAAVAMAVLCAPYAAQAEPPLDPGAVHKTHVPFLGKSVNTRNRPGGGGGGGGGGGTTPPPPATFNLLTYSPANPTLVTATGTGPEAEEEIASDPLNSNNLFAAISDFFFGFNFTKYTYSTDDGTTWADNWIPFSGTTGYLLTADTSILWSANSDPTVAQGRDGNELLCDLYIAINQFGNVAYDGLYVSVAPKNTAITASETRHVFPVDLTGVIQADKPWMAVDNTTGTTSGYIYVTWTEFKNTRHSSTDWIDFAMSTDHGVTWSNPIQINPSTQNGAVQGSQVAVGPDGTVYVVYEVFFAGGQRRQFLTKSTTPGGSTFPAPVAITPLFSELTFSANYRTDSFPSIAVSPTTGTVYVVYSDQPNSTLGAQVEFIQSGASGSGTNNGFSAPVSINDQSAGQQFFPSVAVDGNGVIHASWFDTRNSPMNPEFYDIYATFSKDLATSFATNKRVTSSSIDSGSNPPTLGGEFIGDYAGIAAAVNSGTSEAHPVWTNGGFNGPIFSGDLQTTKLTVP